MAHHHHIHNHSAEFSFVYLISIALNLSFVAFEFYMGCKADSVGLISDAGHNLSDVLSLFIALAATLLLTHGHVDEHRRRLSETLSCANAILLLVAVAVIFYEGIANVVHPADVDGISVSWTAGAGILVNGITTLLLMRGRKDDLNARAAFLHMLADTMVSAAVLVSGILIHFTGWAVIDPVLGIVVAFVILFPALELTKESFVALFRR